MISIQKDHLLLACKYLHRVVPRKPSLPALACVLIDPTLNETRLIATDRQRTAHISIPTGNKIAAMRAKQAGKLLVECGVLANAAATADAGTFLTLTRDQIQLTIGGQLSTIPITTNQVADELSDPTKTELAGEWLPVSGIFDPDAVKRLLRCVSRDETRFILQGICWDAEGYLIATDGRRLHREPFHALPADLSADVIIPTAACEIIPPRAAVSLKFGQSSNYIAFVATENILTIRIYSRLIEGKYPNWRQVLPTLSGNTIRINNQDVAASLKKISKLHANNKDCTATIEVGQGQITLRLPSISSFSAPAIIAGTPTSISFNTKFLIDCLENGGDTFDYQDETSPATITGVKRNQHILMPVRLATNTPTAAEPEACATTAQGIAH